MKKVARLRIPMNEEMSSPSHSQFTTPNSELNVRTTGRIKKPKAVFDPSDNYLPRAQRLLTTSSSQCSTVSTHNPQQTPNSARSTSSRLFSLDTVPPISPDACVVCQKREAKRSSYANKNKLITCLKCEKKVHRLCLDIIYEDYEILRQNFKCENCRTCEFCQTASDSDNDGEKGLVTCVKCVKSYHPSCHIPHITAKLQQNDSDWKCNKCIMAHEQSNGDIIPVKTICEIIGNETPIVRSTTTTTTTTTTQKVNIAEAAAEAKASVKRFHNEKNGIESNCSDKRLKRSEIDSKDLVSITPNYNNSNISAVYSPTEQIDIPDVKYWSVDEVTKYFAKYFPNEAYIFKDQEIDGASLLLMKRSDVIKKLPIKLGPSLRIYNLILKIQTQLNDATLGWNCDL